jgi:hypothetical protein
MRKQLLHMIAAAALLGAAILLGAALPALGQVSTEHPASMVVFPKVVFDGSRDTVVQLTNHANAAVHAYCWYVNGAVLLPLPPGPGNPPLWQTTDFTLTLTQRQPTSWVASRGRIVSADGVCSEEGPPFECYGRGLDPGIVPPVPDGFVGELRCVETDAGGAPVSGNHLTGETTLMHVASGDVSKYSALGIAGFEANDGDATLFLGEEYAGCPRQWSLDHATDGAAIPGAGAGSAITTELTLVPCAADLQSQVPSVAIVQLLITNELEQNFSATTGITCWSNVTLRDINSLFDVEALGTPVARTRILPTTTSGSLLVLAEEVRSAPDAAIPAAAAAANVHGDGESIDVDVVQLDLVMP